MAYDELQYHCSAASRRYHEGTIMRKDEDPGILQAALLGYQQQLEVVNAKIADIRRRLGVRNTSSTSAMAPARAPQKKHRISAEGRARIAAAQRRRWAAAKKAAG
jgi:hypothetical protein